MCSDGTALFRPLWLAGWAVAPPAKGSRPGGSQSLGPQACDPEWESRPRWESPALDVAYRFRVNHEAFWIPGDLHGEEQEERLRVGLTWLEGAEREFGGHGAIAMYAASMKDNTPTLSQASKRWSFVSRRSQARPHGRGPVLAVWPSDSSVLEWAEGLAFGSALCVVSGRWDISPWVTKSGAKCLLPGYEDLPAGPELSEDVAEILDGMLLFDGHNGFIGAGGKENAIRALRRIAAGPDRPDPQAIEDFLFASGETHAKGAQRARQWYEEILAGKRHRGDRGRVI